jgi:PRTRC genetic system protein C
MLVTKELPRIFLMKEQEQERRLADPGIDLSPGAVLNFYSNTFPILTTAKITGPEIQKDEIIYRFESTMGTKG